MSLSPDEQLAEDVSQFYADPLGFVLYAYPWGEKGGPLEKATGPDGWQREFLNDLGAEVRARGFDGVNAVRPIRMAVGSGHGIGKSTLVSWLVNWIMSTRPQSIGTITANTFQQLSTKTWASIQAWTKRCITGHWFAVTSDRIYYREQRESWFANAQTSKEENSESFAGQHAASSTSFYVFDEASAVPDKIFEVAEGGLTDGEPMIFAFGNPTRTTGKFYRVVFGSERNEWNHRSIDSRLAKQTNKEQIAEWIRLYGEDSDFVRVRVRGLPPGASDLQFIASNLVFEAQQREAFSFADDPLVLGVDIARGGDDRCVLRFRKGLDARSIPPIVIPGEQARDSMRVVSVLVDVLSKEWNGDKVAMAFVDATGGSVGGPIADRVRQMGYDNVVDVQFGGMSPDHNYLNMRAWMWGQMRDWLAKGAIDKSERLETDLTGPGYYHDKQDKLVLESKESMKKRGVDSPDDGDALALTFAQPVGPATTRKQYTYGGYSGPHSWMA